jgi:hypothetical protein
MPKPSTFHVIEMMIAHLDVHGDRFEWELKLLFEQVGQGLVRRRLTFLAARHQRRELF